MLICKTICGIVLALIIYSSNLTRSVDNDNAVFKLCRQQIHVYVYMVSFCYGSVLFFQNVFNKAGCHQM